MDTNDKSDEVGRVVRGGSCYRGKFLRLSSFASSRAEPSRNRRPEKGKRSS